MQIFWNGAKLQNVMSWFVSFFVMKLLINWKAFLFAESSVLLYYCEEFRNFNIYFRITHVLINICLRGWVNRGLSFVILRWYPSLLEYLSEMLEYNTFHGFIMLFCKKHILYYMQNAPLLLHTRGGRGRGEEREMMIALVFQPGVISAVAFASSNQL